MFHRCCKQNSVSEKFCCHEKVVAMVTNANLLNSANSSFLMIKYSHKISFDIIVLSSTLKKLICCNTKFS